jgi:hypothetical protein
MTHQSDGQNHDAEKFIIRETWNRTMCSCYTLDLYISLMAQRPQSIRMPEELMHLPCAKSAFRSGRKGEAGLLGEYAETFKERKANTQ